MKKIIITILSIYAAVGALVLVFVNGDKINLGRKGDAWTPPGIVVAYNTANTEVIQDYFFVQKGEYVQMTKDGRTLWRGGEVTNPIVDSLPSGSIVNVYESPRGKGYQIIITGTSTVEYIGYGPDAAEYTYTLPIITSTSTATST